MKIITLTFGIVILMSFFVGQQIAIEGGDLTKSVDSFNTNMNITLETTTDNEITNIVGHFFNAGIGIFKEVSKFSIKYGFSHPEINVQWLVDVLTDLARSFEYFAFVVCGIICLFGGLGLAWGILELRKRYFQKKGEK